ncbi:MAG TPA: serine/threonine-protein kinase [Solirubrobacteraceae bacterium]|jgi:tRNA A-37 threonylcarbamoyl transferase component Bud32|nr:serine/threonine-protein kinase [Solirubrobacteraceae bacterium]
MADDLVIGGQLGNYLIESVIGRGGMSVVYRARHSRLGTSVALKVLAPELSSDDTFRERFLREAQLAASIDHPNVIPIQDLGLHDGSLYIVMRYVSGGDLRALLAESGPLAPRRAVELLSPVALALDAAHARTLVHRDVKPGNILVERSAAGEVEHVYLSDFGIAKSLASVSGLTRAGSVLGTADYMAPEQSRGREVSAATDEYALACVLYQSITGQVPYERDLARGALQPPDAAPEPISKLRPDLPVTLDPVIAKALSPDPSERFTTCAAMLNAASVALASAPTGASATPGAAAASAHAGATAVRPVVPVSASPAVRDDVPAASGAGGEAWPPPAVSPAPHTQSASGAQAPPPPQFAQPPPPGRGVPPGAGRERPARRRRLGYAALLAAIAAGAVVAVVALSSSSTTPKGTPFNAALGQVPTNKVNGSGTATLHLNGNVITVSVTTNGLDYNEQLGHAMHIHAGGKGICPPASAARLHNGHQAIDTVDGIKFYGDAKVALTTNGDTSPASILTFSRYPTGGNIRYSRTITVSEEVARLIRENNAVVIVHGTDYSHQGQYTGVLERSELNPTYPATATAPALCGTLTASGKTTASSGRGAVYTAKLVDNPYAAFLCEASEGFALAAVPRRDAAYARARNGLA